MLQPHRFDAASTSVTGVYKLDTYRKAAGSLEWQAAMIEELDALAHTYTWDMVHLSPHAVPITYRWIYKVKTRFDSSIERYKVHLVARDF